MPIQLTPTRIKGSHYLLIPKDLAQLLEINSKSVLDLTIEDEPSSSSTKTTKRGQRLVYHIRATDTHTHTHAVSSNDDNSSHLAINDNDGTSKNQIQV